MEGLAISAQQPSCTGSSHIAKPRNFPSPALPCLALLGLPQALLIRFSSLVLVQVLPTDY